MCGGLVCRGEPSPPTNESHTRITKRLEFDSVLENGRHRSNWERNKKNDGNLVSAAGFLVFAVYLLQTPASEPSVTNQPCDHLFCLSGIFDGPAVSLAQIKFKAITANGTGIPLLTFQWSPFVPLTSFGGVQIWAEKSGETSWRRGGRAFSLPYRPGCPVLSVCP